MLMRDVLNLDTNTFSIFMATRVGDFHGEPFYDMAKVLSNVSRETLAIHPLFRRNKNTEVKVKFFEGKALVTFIYEKPLNAHC